MRSFFIILICFLFCNPGITQELPIAVQQQAEELAEHNDAGPDEDMLAELASLRDHPLDLNEAERDDLQALFMLTELQVNSFIRYRELLGQLVSIYELQAIPGWDLSTIRKLLPYVTVNAGRKSGTLLQPAQQELWFRVSSQVEKAKGFREGVYKGDPFKLLVRYRYLHKKRQWGFLADKDAGERFFGSKSKGFDFYSGYYSLKTTGRIRALVFGDYILNMGQGLVHWQGFAFGRGSEISGSKRQSPPIKPYTATGEFNFLRGIAVTLRKGRWEMSSALSFKNVDVNLSEDSLGQKFFTSFISSGYHRSVNENTVKNSLRVFSLATRISHQRDQWQVGLNVVQHIFSQPYLKKEEPYNLYAIRGKRWINASVDHSFTYRNIHLFGEFAMDKNFHFAFLEGLLISADKNIDLSLLLRVIEPGYQSLFGSAFTENSLPTNETGFFTGITIRPADNWKLDLYADLFRFSWLKFRTDAPSSGNAYSAQVNFSPKKNTTIYFRLRARSRVENDGDESSPMTPQTGGMDYNFRSHIQVPLNPSFFLRTRFEFTWSRQSGQKEQGSLFFADFLYNPMSKPFGGSARACFFRTDGYASRIYAFENSVFSGFSIPALSGRGFRYYLNMDYKPWDRLTVWIRWSQTKYPGMGSIGSGWDEVLGINKSEWTAQVRWRF